MLAIFKHLLSLFGLASPLLFVSDEVDSAQVEDLTSFACLCLQIWKKLVELVQFSFWLHGKFVFQSVVSELNL